MFSKEEHCPDIALGQHSTSLNTEELLFPLTYCGTGWQSNSDVRMCGSPTRMTYCSGRQSNAAECSFPSRQRVRSRTTNHKARSILSCISMKNRSNNN
ncbi:hypothetical protein TNCT_432081 [Trichonephila clavata]|uniref:Uncharacterized protein n=1 Tax=Trichonephila clavata TaxID=2740835 RepID=A0A8X6I1X8_TRICU|nr:hypothetical protein TNCT_432081 [Trichonephila clavata]